MTPWRGFEATPAGSEPTSAAAPGSGAIGGTTWNWAGYVYCPGWNGVGCPQPAPASEVVGVQGSWTVPAITNTTVDEIQADATWVGIGGAGTSDLVQAGVDGATVGGSPAYAVFWEMAPATATNIVLAPNPVVTPGDQFYVNIQLVGTTASGYQNWSFLVRDNSTDSEWNGTEICGAGCNPSNLSSADWIQESPYLGPDLLELAAFTSARLDGARFLTEGGSWNVLTSASMPLLDISLLDPHYSLSVLGLVSPIVAPGTFWFEYLVDEQGPAAVGRGAVVSTREGEPEEPIRASLNLSSPDSFGPTPATGLALAVALEGAGNAGCLATPSGTAPLNVTAGNQSYEVNAPICPGLANGYYLTAVTLWYVPPGGGAGGNGSLELYSSGLSNGTFLLVDGPQVGPVAVSPSSGVVDAGQVLSLDVVPVGGTPPYTVDWNGLPAGCPSVDLFNITCRPTVVGVDIAFAVISDSVGSSVTSRNVTIIVLPDPVATIVLAPGSVLEGASVVIASSVTGGEPPFLYEWTGLPAGCNSENASFVCLAGSSGDYRVEVTVRDADGSLAEANATLTVDPSVLGLGLGTFGVLVLVGVALAVALALAFRRRRPPAGEGTTGDEPSGVTTAPPAPAERPGGAPGDGTSDPGSGPELPDDPGILG